MSPRSSLFPSLLAFDHAGSGPARAPGSVTPQGIVRSRTPDEVNIAASRARAAERAFAWSAWSPEAFDRARREGKYLLLDGAAEWCRRCHVMDETTYLDPELSLKQQRALAAALTPRSLTERGRMIGELLLAFDEAGVFPWETAEKQ